MGVKAFDLFRMFFSWQFVRIMLSVHWRKALFFLSLVVAAILLYFKLAASPSVWVAAGIVLLMIAAIVLPLAFILHRNTKNFFSAAADQLNSPPLSELPDEQFKNHGNIKATGMVNGYVIDLLPSADKDSASFLAVTIAVKPKERVKKSFMVNGVEFFLAMREEGEEFMTFMSFVNDYEKNYTGQQLLRLFTLATAAFKEAGLEPFIEEE